MPTNAVVTDEQQYSSYLQYLPAIYSEDDFLADSYASLKK